MNESAATLVYDDDCGFCTYWAEHFAPRSDLTLIGFSELEDHPDVRKRLPDDYTNCSHLLAGSWRYSCGASMEEAFARSPEGQPFREVIDILREFPGYNRFREWAYQQFAHNRVFWGQFTSRPPPARANREFETE